MAAFHAIAVSLGQAGLVKELISIIECMRQKPSKKIKIMKFKDWDPCLEPDIVIFNAVRRPSMKFAAIVFFLHVEKKIIEQCI